MGNRKVVVKIVEDHKSALMGNRKVVVKNAQEKVNVFME